MNDTPSLRSRRHFLRLAGGLACGALLSGCGGSETSAFAQQAWQPSASVTVPHTPTSTAGSQRLNLALNLAYIGAQYYSQVSGSSGLSSDQISGIGRAGAATGARSTSFSDATLAGYATALATDKAALVIALRSALGGMAAAQPAIDLSASGAFSAAAQRTGMVAAGAMFDPYAADENFLLGAYLIEDSVAAAYRTLLESEYDSAVAATMTYMLGDATYHGGLIRALLDGMIETNPKIGDAMTAASTLYVTADATDLADQMASFATGASTNIADCNGRTIPFIRNTADILGALSLSTGQAGGFLPNGANGIYV